MRDQYCAEHDFYYNPNHMIDTVCPWCEIVKQQDHLRLLAEAVLEAHNKPTEHGPWAGNDDMDPCPCTACKAAREVLSE